MINPCHPYPPPFALVAAFASTFPMNDRAAWFWRAGVWAFESAYLEDDKAIRLAWYSFAALCYDAHQRWVRYEIPGEPADRELREI